MAIIGRLPDIEKHFKENPAFEKAFRYFSQAMDPSSSIHQRIKDLPMDAFEKVPLEDGMFALEQKFYSKPRQECFLESHKKYIDIQLIVSGAELMECVDISKCTVENEYDSDRDLITYHDNQSMNKILLQDGDFGIYFPNDVHLGCQQYNEAQLCLKTVIKMPITNFY